MNEELMQELIGVMTAAGLPADSSAEIGFHLALHYPEHAEALLAYQRPEPPAEPTEETDTNEPPDSPGVSA